VTTPTLSSKRLILKPQTRSNPRQVEWLNDPTVVQFSEQRHKKHTSWSCQKYVDSFSGETSHIWAIQNLQAVYIGSITAHKDTENQIVEDMGILLGREHWGKGYGSEAWKVISDWLLSDEKIRKIESGTMATNGGMVKVFAKTGFKLEGEQKNHFLVDSAPVGLLRFSRFK